MKGRRDAKQVGVGLVEVCAVEVIGVACEKSFGDEYNGALEI